jgi:hypothetical protein
VSPSVVSLLPPAATAATKRRRAPHRRVRRNLTQKHLEASVCVCERGLKDVAAGEDKCTVRIWLSDGKAVAFELLCAPHRLLCAGPLATAIECQKRPETAGSVEGCQQRTQRTRWGRGEG